MKFGFICPHCKKEIIYDDEYYDRKIAELGRDINDIMAQVSAIKKKPYNERRMWENAKQQMLNRVKDLSRERGDLKRYRKGANKMRDGYMFVAFKEIVKEKYGQDEYMKLIKEAESDIAALTTEELMTKGYSRKKGKRINKI